jgi:hypothetical protein
MVIAGDLGIILTSPDLLNWTQRKSNVNVNFRSSLWSGKNIILAGDSGTIITSENGITWNTINSGTTENLKKITGDASSVITVGGTSLLSSTDYGLTWEKSSLPVPTEIPGAYPDILPAMKDIVWNGTQYIGLCSGTGVSTTIREVVNAQWILISSNKTDWIVNISNIGYLQGNLFNSIFGVISGAGKGCFRTHDGLFWDKLSPSNPSNLEYGISQVGGSNLQIVGYSQGAHGTYSSFDPVYWSFTPMPDLDTDEIVNQIVFMGSYFVAVGDKGQIWISLAKDEMAALADVEPKPENLEHSNHFKNSIQLQYSSNTVTYTLPQSQNITLSLYSLSGKLIAVIDKGQKSAGQHSLAFNSSKQNSGTYFFRLTTERQKCTSKKIVIY